MESFRPVDLVIEERDALRAEREELDDLRRRLRLFVRDHVAVAWLRFALFRVVDHASPSALQVMRDHMRAFSQ